MAPGRIALRPVSRTRISEEVAARISELIAKGQLGPGERLPPERDLEKTLGVSRTSVREAIKYLESKGVVEIRQGSGTTISRTAPQAFLRDKVEAVARSEGGPAAISSARLMLEPAIARLAAGNATAAQVGRMTQATESMRRQIGTPEPTREHDIEFHQALGEACGNPVLTEFALRLCELRRKLPWKAVMNDSLRHPKTQEAFVKQHARIIEAIRRRDPAGAERETRRHVESTATVVASRAGKRR